MCELIFTICTLSTTSQNSIPSSKRPYALPPFAVVVTLAHSLDIVLGGRIERLLVVVVVGAFVVVVVVFGGGFEVVVVEVVVVVVVTLGGSGTPCWTIGPGCVPSRVRGRERGSQLGAARRGDKERRAPTHRSRTPKAHSRTRPARSSPV